jgi:hypothetical protein
MDTSLDVGAGRADGDQNMAGDGHGRSTRFVRPAASADSLRPKR